MHLLVGVVTADSKRQKTIKHIIVNYRPPSTTIFSEEATAVDGKHGETWSCNSSIVSNTGIGPVENSIFLEFYSMLGQKMLKHILLFQPRQDTTVLRWLHTATFSSLFAKESLKRINNIGGDRFWQNQSIGTGSNCEPDLYSHLYLAAVRDWLGVFMTR